MLALEEYRKRCFLRPVLHCALFLALVVQPSTSADDSEAFTPRTNRLAPGVGEGEARIEPDDMPAATVGDYSLVFTVGPAGIAVGGGLLVDFPKAWYTNPLPLIKSVQLSDPTKPHYLSATARSTNTVLNLKQDQLSLTSKSERFRHTIAILVEQEPLAHGAEVVIEFRNTTSPIIAGSDVISVAVDPSGRNEFRRIAEFAKYIVRAGEPATFRLIGPSQGTVGKALRLRFVALDRFFNVAEGFSGSYALRGLDTEGMAFDQWPGGRGMAVLAWTPTHEGWYWPQAFGPRGADIAIDGNPIRISKTSLEQNVYWGDIHSHTRISKDGIGFGEFAYARDVSALDFYASTEHADDDGFVSRRANGDSIDEKEWRYIRERVQNLYEPGRFVTLLGYECSFMTGHYNVYYRGLEGVPWPAHVVKNVETLWGKIQEGEAFTVPHHLGIQWATNRVKAPSPELQPIRTGSVFIGGPRLNWTRPALPHFRPALEIYSAHGQSEYFDPKDPLAYEQVHFTAGRSGDGPHYALDAWAAGHRLGVLSASDDHTARPGQSHYGLTAVFARSLTREDVFDAMASRHSYGTTGERIIVEFEAGGYSMGEEGRASGPIQGRVLVAAPRPIRFATVRTFEEGGNEWRQLVRWDTPGRLLDATFREEVRDKPKTFYLRVELEGLTNNRVARAWSSPIWLSP